jgi:hypothetical protein
MSHPFSPLPVLPERWRVGDKRQVPAHILDQLRGTDAYDSYTQIYQIDGMSWRVESQITEASGSRIYVLVSVNE